MEKIMMKKSKAHGTRQESHSVSKPKPKIRIVHIFAPEIIKIDAANFRELVQRLTGKPKKTIYCRRKKITSQATITRDEEGRELLEKEHNSNGYWSGLGYDVDGLSFFQGFTDFPMLNSSSPMDHMIGEAQVM